MYFFEGLFFNYEIKFLFPRNSQLWNLDWCQSAQLLWTKIKIQFEQLLLGIKKETGFPASFDYFRRAVVVRN